jgi:hypothetical protein
MIGRYPVAQCPRDANIPDAFDVYTLVLLRRLANAPDMPADRRFRAFFSRLLE